GRDGVAGADPDAGAAGPQGDGEVCRLAGDMEARAEPEAGQRPLPLETLPDEAEHRHLAGRPGNQPVALVSQGEIGDVIFGGAGAAGHAISWRRVMRVGRTAMVPEGRARP